MGGQFAGDLRGESRALYVAGVAGGVGTSTWTRVLQLFTRFPVADRGVYEGGPPGSDAALVDVLVTSNTAASTSRLGLALAQCPRPPLLVVMHTATGEIPDARANLRLISPHITARFDIEHRREWLEMTTAPGPKLPAHAKDLAHAYQRFPAALADLLARPHAPTQMSIPPPHNAMPSPAPRLGPPPLARLAFPRAGPTATGPAVTGQHFVVRGRLGG